MVTQVYTQIIFWSICNKARIAIAVKQINQTILFYDMEAQVHAWFFLTGLRAFLLRNIKNKFSLKL